MRLLIPLLLFTLSAFSQPDTTFNFTKKISIEFWEVADSAEMTADTLDLKGAFLRIHVRYSDSTLLIQSIDTLEILHIELYDSGIIRLGCQKATEGEPMPVDVVIREEFMTLDYPFINGIGRTDLYFLKPKQISVSDGYQ